MRFYSRTKAGQRLASQLIHYAKHPNILVIALPRGGVPVAYEVAQRLNAPLDICLVRKLGVPGHRELAMGAIAPGGVLIINQEMVKEWCIFGQTIDRVTTREVQELQRQEHRYRRRHPQQPVCDRTVILIDDGIATGSTIHAAIALLQQHKPQRIIVAAPIIASTTFQSMQTELTEVACLIAAHKLFAISDWYDTFIQTTDEEVINLLARSSTPKNQKSIV